LEDFKDLTSTVQILKQQVLSVVQQQIYASEGRNHEIGVEDFQTFLNSNNKCLEFTFIDLFENCKPYILKLFVAFFATNLMGNAENVNPKKIVFNF